MPNEDIIYAQVLLLDGKIENWKICQSRKNEIGDWKAFWKADRLKDYTMETMVYRADEIEVPAPWTFNAYVYSQLAPKWISQYDYADDFRMARSRIKSFMEYHLEIESICKSLPKG